MERCIALRGLTKKFGAGADVVAAVEGIDLDVEPGEIIALLGPNGAGKTTTIDMILGFSEPSSGEVSVFGVSPRAAVQAGRVSAVLQTGGLLRDLTVGETVELIASTYRDPPAVQDVLARAGLEGLTGRRVQSCSGGEQQRVRFALALLADPDLLVLDEPTTGMDVNARRGFWDSMRSEASLGRTVVFATHYLQEAEDHANRIVLMAEGRIIADGPTAEVRSLASDSTVTARFKVSAIHGAQAALRSAQEVTDVTMSGDRLLIRTSDSDTVARIILNELCGRDLAIHPASLEDAFTKLTEGRRPNEQEQL